MTKIRTALGVVAILMFLSLLIFADYPPDKQTTYTLNYPLTQQQLSQVLTNRGAWVQVDVLKYGDDALPYEKVVHCKVFENDMVYCDVQEVGK